jgi:hypothetical protein
MSAITLLLFSLLVLAAVAQENSWQGSDKGAQLKAQLVDKDKNAARRIAIVEVDVKNVALADPTDRGSSSDMAHLQFRIDGGPYILPMNNKIVFEGLAPGKHTIEVTLADKAFRLLGAKAELEVTIP